MTDALSSYAQQNLELLRHSGLHMRALGTAIGLDTPAKAVKSAIGQTYKAIKPIMASQFSDKIQIMAEWTDLCAELQGVDIPSLISKGVTAPIKGMIQHRGWA